MLKLSLRRGETIIIGENVRIKLMTADYDRVKVQIDAPQQVNIKREKREEVHA